jgi:hypothetical protein
MNDSDKNFQNNNNFTDTLQEKFWRLSNRRIGLLYIISSTLSPSYNLGKNFVQWNCELDHQYLFDAEIK